MLPFLTCEELIWEGKERKKREEAERNTEGRVEVKKMDTENNILTNMTKMVSLINMSQRTQHHITSAFTSHNQIPSNDLTYLGKATFHTKVSTINTVT